MSRRGSPARNRRIAPDGVIPIDPLQSGPLFYYAGTITTGATFTWSDLSGNGLDLVQATAGLQPTKNASSANLGGQPSISFTGGQGLGTASNVTFGSVFELLLVGKITGAAASQIVVETSVAGLGSTVGPILVGFNWASVTGGGYSLAAHGNAGNNWQGIAPPSAFTAFSCFWDMNGASADIEEFRYDNIVQSITGNAGTQNTTTPLGAFPMFFGSRAGAGTTGAITGEYSLFAGWLRQRTAAERAAHQAFIKNKYGV